MSTNLLITLLVDVLVWRCLSLMSSYQEPIKQCYQIVTRNTCFGVGLCYLTTIFYILIGTYLRVYFFVLGIKLCCEYEFRFVEIEIRAWFYQLIYHDCDFFCLLTDTMLFHYLFERASHCHKVFDFNERSRAACAQLPAETAPYATWRAT